MAAMQIVNLALGFMLITIEPLKCLLIVIRPMPSIKALKSCSVYSVV